MRRWLPDRLPEIPEIPEIREATAPKVISGISGISGRLHPVDCGNCHGLERPGADGWSAEDWQVFFDERAGIAEFDGGLPREQAEARAFSCCVFEWLHRTPVFSGPERCLGCGREECSQDPLLPIGIAAAGQAWLHSDCSSAWTAARKAEAIAALALMGIVPPRLLPS